MVSSERKCCGFVWKQLRRVLCVLVFVRLVPLQLLLGFKMGFFRGQTAAGTNLILCFVLPGEPIRGSSFWWPWGCVCALVAEEGAILVCVWRQNPNSSEFSQALSTKMLRGVLRCADTHSSFVISHLGLQACASVCVISKKTSHLVTYLNFFVVNRSWFGCDGNDVMLLCVASSALASSCFRWLCDRTASRRWVNYSCDCL